MIRGSPELTSSLLWLHQPWKSTFVCGCTKHLCLWTVSHKHISFYVEGIERFPYDFCDIIHTWLLWEPICVLHEQSWNQGTIRFPKPPFPIPFFHVFQFLLPKSTSLGLIPLFILRLGFRWVLWFSFSSFPFHFSVHIQEISRFSKVYSKDSKPEKRKRSIKSKIYFNSPFHTAELWTIITWLKSDILNRQKEDPWKIYLMDHSPSHLFKYSDYIEYGWTDRHYTHIELLRKQGFGRKRQFVHQYLNMFHDIGYHRCWCHDRA